MSPSDRRAANLVAEARRRAGLTQAAVARAAGTSQPVVHAYEAARRQPSVVTLSRLLDASGFDLRLELQERPAHIRLADDRDIPAITALANATQLPYQPLVAQSAVRGAMAGESQADRWWWDRLGQVRTVVAEGHSGRIIGACSYAVDREDGIGYILWIVAGDNYAVARALVHQACGALESCAVVRACWFATPLSLGLEGLPAGLLPQADRALRDCGLAPLDLWLWMVTDDLPECGTPVAGIREAGSGWRFEVAGDGGQVVAEAEIGCSGDLGVLWWISVDENLRGQGLGRRLLVQALGALADKGARSAMLFVDHDDPETRNRQPAIALYESVGFRVVDHLLSYESTIR